MAKILVVDDTRSIRKLIEIMLSTHGYEVFTASNGKEGVALFEQLLPDLLITDIVMPDMDGFELIHQICELVAEPKIIAISGSMSSYTEAALDTAQWLGAVETLAKPITEEGLIECVKRALSS